MHKQRLPGKFYELKDGTKLCYNDTGEGRPVIIVHGWGENKRQWASYEKVISEAGYRYICPDQRASKDTEPSKTHPVTFNQIGSVDKVKVPCLFMYPDHGDLVSPNMWMWYRDHMVCDYSAKGFDSASHFFCLEDDCIEESQKTILDFLANK